VKYPFKLKVLQALLVRSIYIAPNTKPHSLVKSFGSQNNQNANRQTYRDSEASNVQCSLLPKLQSSKKVFGPALKIKASKLNTD